MSRDTEIVEVVLRHPELVLTPTIEAVPEVVVELEYQIIVAPDTYDLFFRAEGEDFADFDDAVEADPTVTESEVIIDGDSFRVYRMRLSSAEQLVLPHAARLGMRILHAVSGEGGWVGTLEVPRREELHRFRAYCIEKGVTFRIRRLYQSPGDTVGHSYGLTEAQRETLTVAYELGYFEDPRRASLEEVAEELSISSSAASGRIRRGLGKLVGNTVAHPS